MRNKKIRLADEEQSLTELWNEHIQSRSLDEDAGDEESQYNNNKTTLEDAKDFIIRYMVTLIDRKDLARIPISKKYNGTNMNKFEKLTFQIDETEKILFPDGEKFFSTIIYDEYPIHHGLDGLLDIINHFVEWKDIS